MTDNFFGRAEAKISKDDAQRIALLAFSFMNENNKLVDYLSETTGLHWQDIPNLLKEDVFLAGVLQILCESEEELLAYCRAMNIAPVAINLAIDCLSGSFQEETI